MCSALMLACLLMQMFLFILQIYSLNVWQCRFSCPHLSLEIIPSSQVGINLFRRRSRVNRNRNPVCLTNGRQGVLKKTMIIKMLTRHSVCTFYTYCLLCRVVINRPNQFNEATGLCNKTLFALIVCDSIKHYTPNSGFINAYILLQRHNIVHLNLRQAITQHYNSTKVTDMGEYGMKGVFQFTLVHHFVNCYFNTSQCIQIHIQ